MIELPRTPIDLAQPRIKVLGIGNAGSNALDRIVLDGLDRAELIAVNTDAQVLTGSVANRKIQIGQSISRGLGAGGDPEVGRDAALEDQSHLRQVIGDGNIVILVVGLGGGTGSGAAPLIAEIAREQGAMVVVVATVPFNFEGKRRVAQAEEALAHLRQNTDVLLCFDNDKMGDAVAPNAPIQEAFAEGDRTLSQVVRSLAAFAGRKGLVHTSFDEIATAYRGEHLRSVFGCAEATGGNRAHEALEAALRNPLLGRARLKDDVENVVISVCGGPDLTLNEVQILMEEFQKHVRERTRVFFGAAIDPQYAGKLSVSILGSFEVAAPAGVASPAPAIRSQRNLSTASTPMAPADPDYAESDQADFQEAPEQTSELAEAEQYEEESEEAQAEPEVEQPLISTVSSALPPRPPMRSPFARPAAGTAANLPPRAPREIRAEQMQLEPINRGRFEKSEPTIIDGQDLDVPTFLRRNLKK
jgi:cell division protein FtsZ